MAKTIDDLSNEVTQLREALVKGTELHKWKEKEPDPKDKDNEVEVEKEALLSKLKKHLIGDAPKILTEEAAAPWIKQIGDNYQELHKELSSEILETLGLDTFGAALEKFHEKSAEAWKYALAAFGSLLIPALGVYLAGKLTSIQRSIQQLGDPNRLIRAYDADGNIRPQSRTDVEARERRVANGGTSLADLPSSADTARIAPLTAQLVDLNAQVLKFNNRSTAFFQGFRKLPTDSKAKKAADNIKKIADAVTGIDHSQMQPVAEGVNKINNSMRNAEPKKVEKVAKAVGKLKDSMLGFQPTKIPDGPKLQASADAMKNLASETGTLRTKLNDLRGTIHSLDQQIGATAG
ncbi:hypothetical protein ACIRQF_20945 [Streptomyces sp. NPDC101191]|uniref:hypothetical protein n=1 Tax=Streptomyces sp. NPDC101191 TaxID=3366126 RepID=UPI00381E6515